MSTFVYVVKTEPGPVANLEWSWSEFEASEKFGEYMETLGSDHDVMLFRINVDPHISAWLSDNAGDLSMLGEMRKTHHAAKPEPEGPTYSKLAPTGDGELRIERAEGSDCWEYFVTNRLTSQWIVRDGMNRERIGVVVFGGSDSDGFPIFVVESQTTGEPEATRAGLQEAVEYIVDRDFKPHTA